MCGIALGNLLAFFESWSFMYVLRIELNLFAETFLANMDQYALIYHEEPWSFLMYLIVTSSTAQGGGWSFNDRKPKGEVGCCQLWIAERTHWWTDKWLEAAQSSWSCSCNFSWNAIVVLWRDVSVVGPLIYFRWAIIFAFNSDVSLHTILFRTVSVEELSHLNVNVDTLFGNVDVLVSITVHFYFFAWFSEDFFPLPWGLAYNTSTMRLSITPLPWGINKGLKEANVSLSGETKSSHGQSLNLGDRKNSETCCTQSSIGTCSAQGL